MTEELLHPDLLRLSQLDTKQFMKDTPFCAVFNDMGFGKTVTSLTAGCELLQEGEIKKILVVAPLRVARDTWPDEIQDWAHTSYLSFKFIEGGPEERRQAAKGKEQVHIINQENFVWLVYKAGKTWPYDMVIFDDTKGFKNPKIKSPASTTICTEHKDCPIYENEKTGVCKTAETCSDYVKGAYGDECLMRCTDFKQARVGSKACKVVCRDFNPRPAAYTRYGALLAVRPQIKRLVHLTGTPSSRELADLWPMVHTLDMGKRLGRTYSQYKKRFFICERFKMHLRPGAKEKIFEAIGDICISIECEDELVARHDVPLKFDLDKEAAALYDEFEREYAIEVDDEEVVAQNAGVLSGKLLQVCGGAVYYDTETKAWKKIHDEKIKLLAGVIEKHKGEPILVGYNFAHELQRLREAFPQGIDIRDRRDAVKAWNKGDIPLLFAHPDSAGHGLNMQKGPGRTLVWFGLNWSLDLNKQLEKRLHRPGQLQECYVYYLIAKGRADARVLQTLSRKDRTQKDLLEAVKRDARKKLAKSM